VKIIGKPQVDATEGGRAGSRFIMFFRASSDPSDDRLLPVCCSVAQALRDELGIDIDPVTVACSRSAGAGRSEEIILPASYQMPVRRLI
jgi:hypothetical protein